MTHSHPKTSFSAADENLKHLLSLRALNVSGQLVAILFAVYYLDFVLPIEPLAIVLTGLVIWSLFTLLLLNQPAKVTDNVFFSQLIVDVVALTIILYFTGGATNPFAWFLLVPHSIASTLLSRRYVWLMAVITSLSYSLIVFYYHPLVHIDHPMEMGLNEHFADHVMGMWIGFVLSTFLMAYFVAGMAESLRKRNKLLSDMQERIFRDERMVALGTLATGAAHELGTPLGTMDVVAHELELELQQAGDHASSDKLLIIQGQIKRCKNVLLSITETSMVDKYDSGQLMPIDEYLANVINRWKISNLGINFIQTVKGYGEVPTIISDVALTRAFLNILDNAAHVSPGYVSLDLDWDEGRIYIVIKDEGCGMSALQLAKLGTHTVSSKEAGLGLGIYITKATIEQVGGDIQWENGTKSGVCVSICLPLNN
ncbi:MAG: histidine kinase [Cycloclasticus sp. symbiont of Bathymodiolus heckerae]|nr:MAG: histidine kinase [Cycloclasticus sp. symbiont of Bathymodiolus heckerae]